MAIRFHVQNAPNIACTRTRGWLGHELKESGLEIEKVLANVAGDALDPAGTEFAVVAKVDIS